MKVIIREMVAQDWEAVAHIYYQGIMTNMATFQTEPPTYDAWDQGHIQKCRYVACVEGAVVGWVALSPVSSRCVYSGVAEVSLYIENAHKGKGIGKALLSYVGEQSEKEGFWMLESSIMADNFPSLMLHKKCGFREVGYRERLGQDRYGNWRDTVLVEKRSMQ